MEDRLDVIVATTAFGMGVDEANVRFVFHYEISESVDSLYQEIGRRWRSYEARAFPDDMDFAKRIERYVRASVDTPLSGRLLAWEGLADTGENDEEAQERNARLRHEVELIRERQRVGELDDRLDPAALLLIAMSASNALAVYPQLARGLFGADGSSPELVEHYAEQLGDLLGRRRGGSSGHPD